MPVARSYQSNRIIGEPYIISGRKYVKIEVEPRPGVFSTKQVRYYTDAEYKKMYGEEVIDHSHDPYWKSQKDVLGFKNGYIWIFTGNTYPVKEELKALGAVYRRNWGWGLSSELDTPTEDQIPEGVQMLKLEWDSVGQGEKLLPDDRIQAAVDSLIFKNTPEVEEIGEFVGAVGDRLDLHIEVVRNIETQYGRMMFFEDENSNTYVWATQAKNWDVGETKHIRGTVKKHDEYKGVRQTWLTRCMEVK